MRERVFKGLGISPGIAVGKAFVQEKTTPVVWMHRIQPEAIEAEILRFREAVEDTRSGLLAIKEKIRTELGSEHAYIFDAHLLMLEDPMFVDSVEKHVRANGVNAEFALEQVTSELSRTFSAIQDSYLRERGVDVLDVSNRIQHSLIRPLSKHDDAPQEPSILVAHDVPPSKLASMDADNLLGLATDVGGQTSHTGIIALSKNIPAVVGLHDLSVIVKHGEPMILDGSDGRVILTPSQETLEKYSNLQQLFLQREEELLKTRDLPAITTDGNEVTMMANVEMPEEIESAYKHGAKGIGLYRSEFIFLNNPSFMPADTEHESMYRSMAEAAKEHPVNIRTLDLGGEKGLESLEITQEPNPALGLRGVRFCLNKKSLFKAQLRGILRASTDGNLRIMVPMISGIPEFRAVKLLLEQCKEELRLEGIPFNDDIMLGAMIEVPSAAIIADLLAEEADFLSVGTNDLIQYILAIDRTNESVAYLYEPFHPAVLRTLADIVRKVRPSGKPIAMCGEMAAEPLATPILIGLGFNELSMNAVSIPNIKNTIRSLKVKHCRKIAAHVLKLDSAIEIRAYLKETTKTHYPTLAKAELEPAIGDTNE